MSTMTPIPGDAATLARQARYFQEWSVSLLDASRDLRAVANEGVFISLAINEIRDDATAAGEDTFDVYLRYRGAAIALSDYAVQLRAAQDRANQAIARYHTADGDLQDSKAQQSYYEDLAREPGPEQAEMATKHRKAEDDVDSAQAALSAAWSEYNAAVEDRNRAAEVAMTRLETAAQISGLNDGTLDNVEGAIRKAYQFAQEYVGPYLEELRKALEIVSEALGYLAIAATFLCLIPGLAVVMGPLAAILKSASLVLALASLALTVALFALGRENLGGLLKEAISAALSAVLKAGPIKKLLTSVTVGLFSNPVILKNVSIYTLEITMGLFEGSVLKAGLKGVAGWGAGELVSAAPGLSDFRVSIFEESASGDWNSPPTIEVPDFTLTTDVSSAVSSRATELQTEVDSGANPLVGSIAVCR